MSFESIILNRLQIYDCEIGVVKCLGVYFHFHEFNTKTNQQ
jgi:hypothetical protein